MRAERLPDLVNQNQAKRRSTVETIVTATFDISDVADRLISNEDDEDAAVVAHDCTETEEIESDTFGDFQPLDELEGEFEEGVEFNALLDSSLDGSNGAAKSSHNVNSNGKATVTVSLRYYTLRRQLCKNGK